MFMFVQFTSCVYGDMSETRIFAFSLIAMLLNLPSFCIGYSDVLNKLATTFYSLCFREQTLGLQLYISFKAELCINGPQEIFFLVLKFIKNC